MDILGDFQQSIIDGLLEPVMVVGMDYRVIMMNQAARRFSVDGGEIPETAYCYQISHLRDTPCSGAQHPCPIQEMKSTGKPARVIHQHFNAKREVRSIEVSASPLRDPAGELIGIIELMRDVTDKVKAEQELKDYNERLQALSVQLAEVEDAERQRLARELHDQVGQNLTALGINLNIVKAQLPENTISQLVTRLEDSIRLVEETTERIRDVMSDLLPPVLDDYGLLAALQWYTAHFAWRTEIDISVTGSEPEPRFPKRIEMALFRIAQEALVNIAKHSDSTKVVVNLGMVENTMCLTISDNGKGFDIGQLETKKETGRGLLIIQQRAESVGGKSKIESKPNIGTTIMVEVQR